MARHLLMRRLTAVIALCGLLGPGRTALAQTSFPSDSELQRILEARVANEQAVGLVVGLLDAEGHRTIIAAGDPGPGRRPARRRSTIFEIGSITKTFTATLLAVMAEEGQVSLSEPVARLLPPGARIPSSPGREITLVDLATHTSGLPTLPTNFAPADPANPYADYTMAQLDEFLAGYVASPPTWGRLPVLQPRIRPPRHRAGLPGRTELRRAGDQPDPGSARHAEHGDRPHGRAAGPTGAGPRRLGTAGLQLGPADPGRRRSAALDGERHAGLRGGQPARGAKGQLAGAMREAQRPRRQIATGDSIGLAWITTHTRRVAITWHNGGTGGYRGFLGLDRKEKRAVVILANSANSVDDLGFHLLDPTSPLGRPGVDGPVVRAWIAGGVVAALALYDSLKLAAPDRYDFGEPELNTVGYVLLGRGRIADAITVFQRNVELFPGGYNTYDSLGEAYLVRGDTGAGDRQLPEVGGHESAEPEWTGGTIEARG